MTFNAEFAVTRQIRLFPELAQSPPQPAKIEFPEGIAPNDTCVPVGTLPEHVPELTPPDKAQAIPAELEDTVPVPVPISVTVTRKPETKLAVSAVPPVMVNEQLRL
jgi:hypothetical protein